MIPNLITDLRDVGRFVARTVVDQRTLNRYVFAWGEEMTEKEIYSVMEDVSGEKLPVNYVCPRRCLEVAYAAKVTAQEIEDEVLEARRLFEKEPGNQELFGRVASAEYEYSKYVRIDNKSEYARYLGYLNARQLYPNLKPKKFEEFMQDLLDGKVRRPCSGIQ